MPSTNVKSFITYFNRRIFGESRGSISKTVEYQHGKHQRIINHVTNKAKCLVNLYSNNRNTHFQLHQSAVVTYKYT